MTIQYRQGRFVSWLGDPPSQQGPRHLVEKVDLHAGIACEVCGTPGRDQLPATPPPPDPWPVAWCGGCRRWMPADVTPPWGHHGCF